MSKNFTLDDIREATEAKYGATTIEFGDESVDLRNPLRLTKDERAELRKAQKAMSADDADQEKVIADILTLAAKDKAQIKKLLSIVGDDLAILAEILRGWMEDAQVGEASPSQN